MRSKTHDNIQTIANLIKIREYVVLATNATNKHIEKKDLNLLHGKLALLDKQIISMILDAVN